jgi:hypothetical protein
MDRRPCVGSLREMSRSVSGHVEEKGGMIKGDDARSSPRPRSMIQNILNG